MTDYLAVHFRGRGGIIAEPSFSLDRWRELRFPTDRTPLWALFEAEAQRLGSDPLTWLDYDGRASVDYCRVHEAVFQSLAPHPRVGDMNGAVVVVGVDPILPAVPDEPRFGSGMSFVDVIRHHMDPPTPLEALALVGAVAQPSQPTTYIAPPGTFEWCAGITRDAAAYLRSSPDGLILGCFAPHSAFSSSRARHVVR
jgi:hypothetical protein